ncbi:MAG: hypothetical protein ACREOI_38265 [bacterium]
MAKMYGSMMGGDSHPRAREASPSKAERIVKEVVYGDFRLVAEFPPLQQHQEAMLSLRIHSRRTLPVFIISNFMLRCGMTRR